MEETVWVRGYAGVRGDGVGGWSRRKYEISRMERVEQNTTNGNNIINTDGIEDF